MKNRHWQLQQELKYLEMSSHYQEICRCRSSSTHLVLEPDFSLPEELQNSATEVMPTIFSKDILEILVSGKSMVALIIYQLAMKKLAAALPPKLLCPVGKFVR
jgi:hypothetical protein